MGVGARTYTHIQKNPLKNQWVKKGEKCVEAFSFNVNLSLFKSCFQGKGWGHTRIDLLMKTIEKYRFKNPLGRK